MFQPAITKHLKQMIKTENLRKEVEGNKTEPYENFRTEKIQ